MLGFALLGLLGIGLIFGLSDSDDDAPAENENARIEGTDGDDLIDAGPGNDTVFAGPGDDFVDAGPGDDRVFGGDDDDLIVGAAGDDFLRGGSGDDMMFGGAGSDELNGDVGDDVLAGADIIDAEGLVAAGMAAAQNGQTVNDVDLSQFIDLDADPLEADTLNGGVGDDIIIAGSNDLVDTGSGSDVVNVGEWVVEGQPVNIVGFNPAKDAIVYSYSGPTTPSVSFGEDDDGTATLNADGQIVAYFPNVDFFDLTAQSGILLERVA